MRIRPPKNYQEDHEVKRLPRQSKPSALNKHHTTVVVIGQTEWTYHATKGWRKRRNVA